MDQALVENLLVILTAGLVVGVACRKLGISELIGYLVVGTLLGEEALGWVRDVNHDHSVEHLAEVGVFLLLFSIGLEFSLDELARLGRWMVIGGLLQMSLVAGTGAAALWFCGLGLRSAILLGIAGSFSSTVLVFKALAERGQVNSPHGRRGIGILLFQDVAVVPLLLLIPLIAGSQNGESAGLWVYLQRAASAVAVIVGVIILRWMVGRWAVSVFARLRSPELLILAAVVLLGGVTYAVAQLGLPPALGAFAAGLVLSDNRLTGQIDALILPFRECFAAIFFVSLGLLVNPFLCWEMAPLLVPALIGVLLLKTAAAALGLWATGLRWFKALGMGMGLAQIGEFALVVALVALNQNLISQNAYQVMLALSLGTLIVTPMLLRLGLYWSDPVHPCAEETDDSGGLEHASPEAVVIGIGPVGRQISSRLELDGVNVCLVDLSPVNLYSFAQQGFRTTAGDASDPSVLLRADADRAGLVVVCVPDDEVALRIVRSVRELNSTCRVLVRCRYVANVSGLRKAGANSVVSEEGQASEALLKMVTSEQTVPITQTHNGRTELPTHPTPHTAQTTSQPSSEPTVPR